MTPRDPGANPLDLWVLYTYETAGGLGTGSRTYLYAGEKAAQSAGEKLKAAKPSEVSSFEFMVLPLEGPPVI